MWYKETGNFGTGQMLTEIMLNNREEVVFTFLNKEVPNLICLVNKLNVLSISTDLLTAAENIQKWRKQKEGINNA